MAVSAKFQKRITQLVDDTDLSKSEVRNKINIGSSAFSNALIYGILPKPRTLIKIADYFDVSIEYLLGETNKNDFIPSIEKPDFHTRFAMLCNEKGVTHYRVGNDCGFDKSLISKWFTIGYLPSLDTLQLLCDYFKVSPDYLLGRSDYKN